MLLSNAGLAFEATTADIDERAIQQGSKLSAPGEIATLLAREKARWIEAFHDPFLRRSFRPKADRRHPWRKHFYSIGMLKFSDGRIVAGAPS